MKRWSTLVVALAAVALLIGMEDAQARQRRMEGAQAVEAADTDAKTPAATTCPAMEGSGSKACGSCPKAADCEIKARQDKMAEAMKGNRQRALKVRKARIGELKQIRKLVEEGNNDAAVKRLNAWIDKEMAVKEEAPKGGEKK